VYSLILSAQTHVDYGVGFRFLQAPTQSEEVRRQGMQRITVTAYMLYLDLLRMTGAHLGQPPLQTLGRFDELLKRHLTS
jgi:hypothetical protein